MSLKAKYQYTHFIYPFVVDEKKYTDFIYKLNKNPKLWKLKIHDQKEDETMYNFFLPYMRKFLFPTLFWSSVNKKEIKRMGIYTKSSILSKLTCVEFDYNLSNIKTGKMKDNNVDTIGFDITKIKLVCFMPGICFLDIRAEIDEKEEYIDFNKILDFNHTFRKLTPRAIKSFINENKIKAKSIDKLETISNLILSITKDFEVSSLEKIYYDKMFTYSYTCIDGWEKPEDFKKFKNEFLKYQYVMSSNDSGVFSNNCSRVNDNMYSRWGYSMFGFSRESLVVLVSDKEKYNITRLPYVFENTYMYMFLLAFYQRIRLLNFSQDLMENNRSMVKKLNKELTNFTHFSWFSQITNSEHGMDIWKCLQNSFELELLYEEVHKEYAEYYEFVATQVQGRINSLLILIYIVSVIFSGLQILTNMFDLKDMENFVIITMVATILIYPIYSIIRYIKSKYEVRSFYIKHFGK